MGTLETRYVQRPDASAPLGIKYVEESQVADLTAEETRYVREEVYTPLERTTSALAMAIADHRKLYVATAPPSPRSR